MKHYIYKTEHINGKYYIGRHSTNNVDDGYKGSGKWVRLIKDKSLLSVTVLEETNSLDDLKKLEEKYLAEHLGKPNNMNFNQNSVGFASGDLHPNKTKEARERIRVNNPGKKLEHREKMRSDANPAKLDFVREKISKRMTGAGNPMSNPEHRAKLLGDNNPSKRPEVAAKISASRTGIKLAKVPCECCGKLVSINHYPNRHMKVCPSKL